MDNALHYIKDNFVSSNIIIVGDGKRESNLNNNQIKDVLKGNDSIQKISIITPEKGYIEKTKFTDVLLPNTNNLVVLTTDDDVLVASAINSLISLPEETTAKVFTFDKSSVINKIDVLSHNFQLMDEMEKWRMSRIDENTKLYNKLEKMYMTDIQCSESAIMYSWKS